MDFTASGIGAAINGFYQGRNEEESRQRTKVDQDYQDSQRAFQQRKQEADFAQEQANNDYLKGQRQRQVDAQGREDTLRTDLSSIPSTRQVNVPNAVPNDDEGNAMPVATKSGPNPEWNQLRQAADAFRKAGKFDAYLESSGKADALQLTEATRRLNQLEAGAAGKTTAQIAQEAKQIFDNDPFPQRVTGITEQPDGSVVAEMENTQTGQRVSQTYKDPADIINGLKAIYNEKGYAALQIERQKAAIKAAEAQNDPSKRFIKLGNSIYDTKTGGFTQGPVPPGMEAVGVNSDGQVEYKKFDKTGGGSGAGAGTGKGGKGAAADDVVAQARTILGAAAEKSEDKLTGDQRLAAEDNLGRLASQNPNMPAAMVARVATDLAKNPNKTVPAINPMTGQVDLVYDDGVNGKVRVHVGVGDALNLASVSQVIAKRMAAANGGKEPSPQDVEKETRRAMVTMTKNMLDGFGPKQSLAYSQAAADPVARQKLEATLVAQADTALAQAVAKSPSPELRPQLVQAKDQMLARNQQALTNVLNLIHNYGPKAAAAPGAAAQPGAKPGSAPAQQVGGLRMFTDAVSRGITGAANYKPEPNSPAAKAAEVRSKANTAAAQMQQQRDFGRAELSRQFRADQKTMKPLELVRKYDAMRRDLPTEDAVTLKQLEQQL